jgi:hypothetical protein
MYKIRSKSNHFYEESTTTYMARYTTDITDGRNEMKISVLYQKTNLLISLYKYGITKVSLIYLKRQIITIWKPSRKEGKSMSN